MQESRNAVDFVERVGEQSDAHRFGPNGLLLARDLSEAGWQRDLASEYDVVVAVNTAHWFSVAKAAELFGGIFQSLRSGGVFLLMEPAGAEPPFAPSYGARMSARPG